MLLRLHELYRTIQGESSYAGRPCTMVRTARCDLRCDWCDTEDAFTGGEDWPLAAVQARIALLGADLVEITGGEPLLQAEPVAALCRALLDDGATVLLETGGHHDLAPVPRAVVKIVDLKCPASGESARTCWANLPLLAPHDELKFVLADRGDYDWACAQIRARGLDAGGRIIHFSPVLDRLAPRELAGWMLADRPPARLGLQLHKFIWGAGARGV